MRLPKITSLYGRIFAIFWFTMFLVILAVLALPHLDPRKSRDISPPHYDRMLKIRDQIEQNFAFAPDLTQVLNRLEGWSRRGPNDNKLRLFISDLDGNVITTDRRPDFSYKALRNFVTSIDNPQEPQQKLYGKTLISGPLPVRLAKHDYFLYIGARWSEPPHFLLQLFDHPFRLLLAVMLVSTPLLLWLAWALSQPARRLERAAQRVAQGVFEIDPALEKGTSEFRQAGASFNQMVEAVNLMISRQQRLLSDISHELRSPLTRLRMAQALAKRKLGESTDLTRIDTEAQRLEQMIGKLLELSSVQVDSHLNREIQPLSSLFDGLLADSQFEAEQVGKTLLMSEVPHRMIHCHPQLLMSALENIIRNAIHYGKKQVLFSLTVHSDMLSIRVEDDGDGVPDDEFDSIFRPFYRVSTARDRHSGGAGLGLAIAENAIRQHNGTIKAARSSLGGLLVEVTLPLQKAP
ncbi:envelope stress sensor histidine kinase CpxA [Marinomonas rhizomae]|uniref:histidine kinase n=1 Tax=Marinomonas rhizomae TaxID=491948 RepID=A0A366JHB2_9GAMM|nr:envelope stress sensor histidine kinase CpxA [Marinomonas rhizomae]RBP85715.1 two-component system sensor histidine kinase CpxA [Marinomonas rhizomae]RNF75661.1 envelope stress sensor histidine kinase CpxA [Marinomonas rhizomae]